MEETLSLERSFKGGLSTYVTMAPPSASDNPAEGGLVVHVHSPDVQDAYDSISAEFRRAFSHMDSPCPPDYCIIKLSDGSLLFTDARENLIFRMIRDDSTLHLQMKLFNKAGTDLLLTLRQKNRTGHGRWEAKDPSQKLLYSVCKNHMIQDEDDIIDLRVMRGSSFWRRAIAYTVIGKPSNHAFSVYKGVSSTPLACVLPDALDENKYLLKLDHQQGNKTDDCDQYLLMETVFSIAAIVDVVKTPSRPRVIADDLFHKAGKLIELFPLFSTTSDIFSKFNAVCKLFHKDT
ncbi:hypothetical protein QVD17_32856 [Tagetes erecta]|uniref:Uncharacterized protein n=1 Tax=Tagetes erecta TaxID=13708 RepID=A0AAD8JWS8_TARER|nr:hypothetical protein QVD17_32856 [Tagetes erecta]